MQCLSCLFVLDVFKPDDNFMENEEKYKQLKKGTCVVSIEITYAGTLPYQISHVAYVKIGGSLMICCTKNY